MNTPVKARINVQLRELAQLFNSMDPSPFHDRDLDKDAEAYIVDWARELPPTDELELTIHVTAPPPPDRALGVDEAVRHYFDERAKAKGRELRLLLRLGRRSLLVGLLFLSMCLVLAELLATFGDSTFSAIIKEGLTIAGWVAMWRPLQTYLYDWWPLRAERRVLERLARMPVHLIVGRGATEPAAPVGMSLERTRAGANSGETAPR